MAIPLYLVDAFTDQPFAGNPAAVCLLPVERDAAWMQAVAAEMNLSETAFLVRGTECWKLRWFTPGAEVRLCGHATLASAHVLWGERGVDDRELRFETLSGVLTARRRDAHIELDFPARVAEPCEPPPGLLAALGVGAQYVGRSVDDVVVLVADEAAVRRVDPDFRALASCPARGVIVTARADGDDADFVSRFFAPAIGVDEDPVTGSAHCCLAPFWAERLGRTGLVGYQASSRGGRVEVETVGDRVRLRGRAVTTVRGELSV